MVYTPGSLRYIACEMGVQVCRVANVASVLSGLECCD